jgi:hypothetical protein
MSSEPFTEQDANSIIQVCRSAPLQNMATAEAVNALLAKFATWANDVLGDTSRGAPAPAKAAPQGPADPILDPLVPTRLGMIKAGLAVEPPATVEELASIGRT